MTAPSDRIVTADYHESDAGETSIRPQVLDDFIGQSGVRQNLKVFIEAARTRGAP